jgi:hypothetical protein
MGTFSVNDTPVKILFDSGAIHSFISEKLISKMGLKGSHTNSAYKIEDHVWFEDQWMVASLCDE